MISTGHRYCKKNFAVLSCYDKRKKEGKTMIVAANTGQFTADRMSEG